MPGKSERTKKIWKSWQNAVILPPLVEARGGRSVTSSRCPGILQYPGTSFLQSFKNTLRKLLPLWVSFPYPKGTNNIVNYKRLMRLFSINYM